MLLQQLISVQLRISSLWGWGCFPAADVPAVDKMLEKSAVNSCGKIFKGQNKTDFLYMFTSVGEMCCCGNRCGDGSSFSTSDRINLKYLSTSNLSHSENSLVCWINSVKALIYLNETAFIATDWIVENGADCRVRQEQPPGKCVNSEKLRKFLLKWIKAMCTKLYFLQASYYLVKKTEETEKNS